MDKDELVISRITDRIAQARDGYYATATGFLDSHEQALARRVSRSQLSSGVTMTLYGGYEEAERRLAIMVPEDWYTDDFSELLTVVRVDASRGSRPLTHRDYLGSILGLGLDRSVIGDILVRPDGADIIVTSDIADFLLSEYSQVGRAEVRTSLVSLDALIMPELRRETVKDTVPSLRLDNIVSSAFKLSRANAVTAIRSGLVSVDHVETTKPDARIEEGSTLVLKGKGKAILKEIGGESKKGRIWIIVERFV